MSDPDPEYPCGKSPTIQQVDGVWVWSVDGVPVTFTNMLERLAIADNDYIRDLSLRISHHRSEEFIQCTVRFDFDYKERPDGSYMMGRRFTGTRLDLVAVDIINKLDKLEGLDEKALDR